MKRRSATAAWALLLLAALLAVPSFAQFPERPVKVIVPFPAGGGGDTLARTVTNRLAIELKQPIAVDNRAGAGANLGAEIAAHAPPDGYTIFYGTNGTHAINQSLYRKLPFDMMIEVTVD